MAIDKKASRRWLRRIREVLNTDWDPIGGCPDDEYDGYVGKVAAMLRDGTSDSDLAAYLRWAETAHMGLPERADLEVRLTKTIAHLRNIGLMN